MQVKINIIIAAMVIGLFLSLHANAMERFDTGERVRALGTADKTGRIQYGNLKIYPMIALDSVYDDNIFLQSDRSDVASEAAVEDWINHVVSSLSVIYILPERGSVSAGYKGDYAFYADHDENDHG